MSESAAFDLLHPGLQKAIYDKGWTSLHPIQSEAIRTVYQTQDHLLVSTQTAGGKTEAAFLPIISKIAERGCPSVQALYVGPLRALINDQFRRMEELCENLSIPVHRWHGDVGASEKHSVLRDPGGILLITPESLEAIFLRRGKNVPSLFSALEYVVIDELHSFLDSVRGIHLQSLLSRVRVHAGCSPRMAGLSATLGDYDAAKRFLDIDQPARVRLIENPANTRQIKLGLKAFTRPRTEEGRSGPDKFFSVSPDKVPELVSRLTKQHFSQENPLTNIFTVNETATYALPRPDDLDLIANDIALKFTNSTNLVFCNSKSTVEILTDKLHQITAKAGSSQDPFIVHHASLSREQRDDAEELLKSGQPATALCSSTLEMGIDISGIRAVGQVQPPWTVSSMVQRLGRSGRGAGESAIFRLYSSDRTPHAECTLTDLLFPELIQSIAMIQLMLTKWIESPEIGDLNLSTLIHQILSHLTQTGGLSAQALFDALVKKGPFRQITPDIFESVLKSLQQNSLIGTTPTGIIIVGVEGEYITTSYDFYAAFLSKEEFKVEHSEEAIGKIPSDLVPPIGENLLLGGRRWVVVDILSSEATVVVLPAKNMKPPFFNKTGRGCGDKIARQMKTVLEQDEVPVYIDDNAKLLLGAARRVARLSGAIDGKCLVQEQGGIRFFPWSGSKIMTTLWAFAKFQELSVTSDRLSIFYRDLSLSQVQAHFTFIAEDKHDPIALANFLPTKTVEKFDGYLADELLNISNSQRQLDLKKTASLVVSLLT